MSNPAAKWNLFDSFLYKVECIITKLLDPEEMIIAATKYLKDENDQLKRKEYPGTLKSENGKYFCPDCQTEIPDLFIDEYHTKYCPECGKRIMPAIPSPYAALYKDYT